jgi:anti-sigma B factor antagonist
MNNKSFLGKKVLESQIINNALVIKVLEERIDLNNFDSFSELLEEASTKSPGLVVLDLDEVSFLDSSGLGSVLSFCRFLNNSNRELRVANCNTQVMTLFKITELSDKIPLFENLEDAIKDD